MGSNRRMDHMTWPEFKEAKTRPVIVPIGSTEQITPEILRKLVEGLR